MFVVVAVEAKELPVAAVRRIIVMVMVTMMNRQFLETFA